MSSTVSSTVSQDDPVLAVEELSTVYLSHGADVEAVREVSFALRRGRRYGLVGESGSGKSSIIRAVLGLVRPPNRVRATTLRFDGTTDLLGLPPARMRQLRGAEIGYVGQNPFGALHPVLSIGEQYHQFLKAHGQGRQKSAHLRRAAAALEELGLEDPRAVLRGHAGELSGGMAQRVVLGFCTLLDPKLIIADEPTTALDVTVQRQVLDLLAQQTQQAERTLLLVTHDLSVVAQYCDDVIVLRRGRVVETGPVAEVFPHPMHPYTESLLASVPRRDTAPRPPVHTGVVPAADGCQYAGSCPHVQEDCVAQRPVLLERAPGRAAACHHALAPSGERPAPVSASAEGATSS